MDLSVQAVQTKLQIPLLEHIRLRRLRKAIRSYSGRQSPDCFLMARCSSCHRSLLPTIVLCLRTNLSMRQTMRQTMRMILVHSQMSMRQTMRMRIQVPIFF